MNVRLKELHQLKVFSAADIYFVMQRILMRENRIDRNREHLWTICLDTAHKILNIELVSLGSINKTIIEPMEVFSVPLQKRAVTLVLVHNHPSGELTPSLSDKDMTDRLIQCGVIMNVPVLDHLIITEQSYLSFNETGLLEELQRSKKYVPDYKVKEGIKKQVEEEVTKSAEDKKAREMARVMKQNGEPIEKIMQYTGLRKEVIQRIKIKD